MGHDYIYSLDLLRVISALVVIFVHYKNFYFIGENLSPLFIDSTQPFYFIFAIFYNYGWTAVQLFWIISGFTFALVYFNREKVTGKEFFVNRFARLYPLVFITLIIITILQTISWFLFQHFQLSNLFNAYNFLLSLFFISGWGLPGSYSFNAPVWSVSVEIIAYIIFFAMLPYFKKFGNAILVIITCGVFASLFYGFLSTATLMLVYFFVGCILYQVYEALKEKKLILFALGVLGIILAGLVYVYQDISVNNAAPQALFELFLFCGLIIFFLLIESKFHDKFNNRLKVFGSLHYSIYLWHMPLTIIVLLLFEYFGVNRSVVSNVFFLVAWFVLIVVVAYFSYVYFENPLRKYIKKKLLGVNV